MKPYKQRTAPLTTLLLALVLCAASLLTAPGLRSGLPYLYREDEGHHFNRVMEMAKDRRFDPEYFNKPSLHFYLRLPAVWAAEAYLKWKGEIQSLSEVRTRDQFGLGGYAYTASHPKFVIVSRLVSLSWYLILVVSTFAIAYYIGLSSPFAILSALLTAISPEVVENATIVGVDTLMAMMVALTVLMALPLLRKWSLSLFLICCLCAGLAVSSKYNALPIVAVPFIAALAARQLTPPVFVAASVVPVIGFFVGTPFALIKFSDFVAGLRYETWHYAIAGHEGHTAERGIPQLIFYLRWLVTDGVGIAAAVAALFGLVTLLTSKSKQSFVFLAFPILYGILMISQRANFTRNMVAIVPFVSILASYIVFHVNRYAQSIITLLLISIILPQPFIRALALTDSQANIQESRQILADFLRSPLRPGGDVALSRNLQIAPNVLSIDGVTAMDTQKPEPVELAATGFDHVIVPASDAFNAKVLSGFELARTIPGILEYQRIPVNPRINIYSLGKDAWKALQITPQVISLIPGEGSQPCDPNNEGHCWIQSRSAELHLTNLDPVFLKSKHETTVTLEVMSPWPTQQIILGSDSEKISFDIAEIGRWKEISFKIPKISEPVVPVKVKIVSSPKEYNLSEDVRRLGLAIKGLHVSSQ